MAVAQRLGSHLSVVLLLAAPIVAAPAWQIQPADIFVSKACGGNAWVGYVRDGRGRQTVYELLLEPQYDVRDRLVGWDLLLFRPDAPGQNLLEPKGGWHGLQPFNFVAADLLHGAEQSAFGLERRMPIRGSSTTLVARITDVEVAGDEIEYLRLRLALK